MPELPDPIITAIIDELREENEKGNITCLALVVVKHDGEASSSLHGRAQPVTLLGAFEMLKGSVLRKEFADEGCVPEHLN